MIYIAIFSRYQTAYQNFHLIPNYRNMMFYYFFKICLKVEKRQLRDKHILHLLFNVKGVYEHRMQPMRNINFIRTFHCIQP